MKNVLKPPTISEKSFWCAPKQYLHPRHTAASEHSSHMASVVTHLIWSQFFMMASKEI